MVPPVYALAAPKVSTPLPSLVSEPAPLIVPSIVAFALWVSIVPLPAPRMTALVAVKFALA